ncbi:MAG: hypothetical protein Sv326_0696 [Candidatus Fermentimicrarchaeum limneticum]|uniref:Tyr recombinase domain-containing protein n=1 Tax=Fermentimicrarchaeum limneticum TaxID=2795018 RepID=A0A7D5XCU9_FERL1|nr:MAG: hypothetical protein Sv326_0696 [Candidatus Fermentimicrarchaeum limneticum]
MTWTTKQAIDCLDEEESISKDDKELIKKFVHERKAISNLRENTVIKIICLLKMMTKMQAKPWKKFKGRADVVALTTKINESKISIKTRENLRQTFKQFYKWLIKNPHPLEIEDVRTKMEHQDRKLPENMLVESDVLRMVDSEQNLRNKAILMTLWSSGARAAELLGMKVGSVIFDEYGARVMLSGKTGDRYVRVVEAAPYLKEYLLKVHPDKDNIAAPLWVMIFNQGKSYSKIPLTYPGLKRITERTAARCGIQKPTHPHAWRASRATFLAKFLTSSQLKVVFGWTRTAMCDTYISMLNQDVDTELLRINGKVEEKKEESILKPVICPKCKIENRVDSLYCSQCSFPLTDETLKKEYVEREKRDRFMDWLMKQPKVKKMLSEWE